MKCEDCTCTYESCSCYNEGSECAYELDEEFKKTNEKISKIFKDIQDTTLSTMPFWMRCNFISNSITKSASKLNREIKDEDINWKEVYRILSTSDIQYDYNISNIDNINTIEDFENIRFIAVAASCSMGPWYKQICKQCNEEFTMTYNEIKFFEDKKLNIPKRCKSCRDKNKQSKK